MTIHSVFRSGLFDGKTIVITGGGTGIGRATARELAALGGHVVICSRSAEHLETTRAEIAGAGGNVTALTCNIRRSGVGGELFGRGTRAGKHGRWTGQQCRWPVHQPRGGDHAEGLARRRGDQSHRQRF